MSSEARSHAFIESKTRTHHGRVEAGQRTAGRRGGTERGRTERRQFSSPKRRASLLPPKASRTPVLNIFTQARTHEMLCKPTQKQNFRFTTDSFAGRRPLFVPCCKPMCRRLLVSVNAVDVRHLWKILGINQYNKGIQNISSEEQTHEFSCKPTENRNNKTFY